MADRLTDWTLESLSLRPLCQVVSVHPSSSLNEACQLVKARSSSDSKL